MSVLLAAAHRRNAAGGPSYLLSEDWTGTGLPSGWTFDGTGTCNPDATAAPPPIGGEYLAVSSNTNSHLGGAQFVFPSGPYSDLWLAFWYRTGGNISAINRSVYFTNNCSILFDASAVGGEFGGNGGPALGLSANTWYHVWLHLTTTTQDIFIASNETRPGSPTASRSGSFSATDRFCFSIGHSSGAGAAKVRASLTEIGSNPP